MIPPKIAVPICIEQGSLYHFHIQTTNHDGTTYKGNRFFIVLNVNPKTDEVLVLTTMTSKVQNAEEYAKKVGEDAETIVKISLSDFPRLSQDSAVNCNSVYPMTREDLILSLEQYGAVMFSEKLSKSIIEALVRGVLKSKQVSNEHKQFLI